MTLEPESAPFVQSIIAAIMGVLPPLYAVCLLFLSYPKHLHQLLSYRYRLAMYLPAKVTFHWEVF